MVRLGIGTTGLCNMNCEHCYSRQYNGKSLTLDDIIAIYNSVSIESVNFGTGENILNPEFLDIVDFLAKKGVKLSLTTNGFSVANIDDERLKLFHDIDFSLEFPTRDLQNEYRGNKSWEMVISGMERCKKLNIPFSIATVLMKKNADMLVGFSELMRTYGCYLRINVLKSNTDETKASDYALTYDLFWKTFAQLFEKYSLVSCSEPILCAALKFDNTVNGVPCGQSSIRIQPDGQLLPCVYWGKTDLFIADLLEKGEAILAESEFTESQVIPTFCKKCERLFYCHGGCASRRKIAGNLDCPDEFCPIYAGREFPLISYKKKQDASELIHSQYLCTIIFGV